MDCLAYLVERYPRCFDPKHPKPLKLRIRDDLVAAGVPYSNTQIQRALHAYCRTTAYLTAMAAGGGRYDLDGEQVPGWVITKGQSKQAARLVARRAKAAKLESSRREKLGTVVFAEPVAPGRRPVIALKRGA